MSLPPPTSSQSPSHIVMAKGDSAASHHYWRDQDSHVLSTIRPSLGPSVLLPNGDKISSTKAGTLPLHSCLTDRASTAMILPSLKSASLISIGQLCDDNCEVFLNKTSLVAVKNDDIILEGIRNPTDGLWDIPVRKTTLHEFNHPLPPSTLVYTPNPLRFVRLSNYLLIPPGHQKIRFLNHFVIFIN